MTSGTRKLITVSNRLPIVLAPKDEGWSVKPGEGGLVTALAPVLRNRGGTWIGWSGTHENEALSGCLDKVSREVGYRLVGVPLSEAEVDGYYFGFSNEVLWPLFHDLHNLCRFEPDYWRCYGDVNKKFAGVIEATTSSEDFVWIHDYHLLMAARELRRLGRESKIGFFLHIPFPPPDIYLKLPWRFEILDALLDYDLLGFQTMRDKRNFLTCLRLLVKEATFGGKGTISTVGFRERTLRVGSFPISIDAREFAQAASSEDVAQKAWFLHEDIPDRKIILGLDRLDYSKGIPERLRAFRNALRRYPELREKVTLVQVVVPSRATIDAYNSLREEIELLVSAINGEYTRSGWVPVHYMYRSLSRDELLAYYRTCEIALITPLKDGMNLVAKEYCACNLEEQGVLILSEFAGAASQMHRAALTVNPYDIEGIADAIHKAVVMLPEERKHRMHRLRRSVVKNNIYKWVDGFLRGAFSKAIDDFPLEEDFVPQMDLP